MPVLQIRDDAFTMTTLLRWQTEHRLLPLVLAASLVVMMACIAGVLWAPVSPGSAPLQPLSEARQAYQQVVVDISTRADLARLGFGENKGARALAGLVREGKIARVDSWLESLGLWWGSFGESFFYSDSHNDLPLMHKVTTPVAVDPDDKLRAHAEQMGWKIITLR